jgi:colicin import membrane protein
MARKLKTYQTSQGFFDLVIAAPSMKAALESWGSNINLFHKGFARETDDPEIIAAALKRPGVVLKRPVGTDEPFQEHAHLPTSLAPTGQRRAKPTKSRERLEGPPAGKIDDRTARKAARALQREQREREKERRNEEAARAKERERRQHAIAKAQADLDDAKGEHEKQMSDIEKERAALDKRAEAAEARWQKQREHLQAALRRAGG